MTAWKIVYRYPNDPVFYFRVCYGVNKDAALHQFRSFGAYSDNVVSVTKYR